MKRVFRCVCLLALATTGLTAARSQTVGDTVPPVITYALPDGATVTPNAYGLVPISVHVTDNLSLRYVSLTGPTTSTSGVYPSGTTWSNLTLYWNARYAVSGYYTFSCTAVDEARNVSVAKLTVYKP